MDEEEEENQVPHTRTHTRAHTRTHTHVHALTDVQSGPDLDDLLALELRLQPDGLSQGERNELDSVIKQHFSLLLNEPRLSLRRSLANVGGIMRGYLRRGNTNMDWVRAMRGS